MKSLRYVWREEGSSKAAVFFTHVHTSATTLHRENAYTWLAREATCSTVSSVVKCVFVTKGSKSNSSSNTLRTSTGWPTHQANWLNGLLLCWSWILEVHGSHFVLKSGWFVAFEFFFAAIQLHFRAAAAMPPGSMCQLLTSKEQEESWSVLETKKEVYCTAWHAPNC